MTDILLALQLPSHLGRDVGVAEGLRYSLLGRYTLVGTRSCVRSRVGCDLVWISAYDGGLDACAHEERAAVGAA